MEDKTVLKQEMEIEGREPSPTEKYKTWLEGARVLGEQLRKKGVEVQVSTTSPGRKAEAQSFSTNYGFPIEALNPEFSASEFVLPLYTHATQSEWTDVVLTNALMKALLHLLKGRRWQSWSDREISNIISLSGDTAMFLSGPSPEGMEKQAPRTLSNEEKEICRVLFGYQTSHTRPGAELTYQLTKPHNVQQIAANLRQMRDKEVTIETVLAAAYPLTRAQTVEKWEETAINFPSYYLTQSRVIKADQHEIALRKRLEDVRNLAPSAFLSVGYLGTAAQVKIDIPNWSNVEITRLAEDFYLRNKKPLGGFGVEFLGEEGGLRPEFVNCVSLVRPADLIILVASQDKIARLYNWQINEREAYIKVGLDETLFTENGLPEEIDPNYPFPLYPRGWEQLLINEVAPSIIKGLPVPALYLLLKGAYTDMSLPFPPSASFTDLDGKYKDPNFQLMHF